jgi:hypothetical protein
MRTQMTWITSSGELKGDRGHSIKLPRSASTQTSRLRIGRANRSILVITMGIAAFGLGVLSSALAGNYSDLETQGYRWVSVDGPYACAAEEDVQRIVGHHTDEAELHMVESIRCYYLIPGTIAQLIKEDPAMGTVEIRLGGVTRPLWTYTKFLSKRPVRDTYGVIETPENAGLIQNVNTLLVPTLPDRTTTETRQNGNP